MSSTRIGIVSLLRSERSSQDVRGSGALKVALNELDTRFASALLDAGLPKSKSMFGKGLAGAVAREALVNSLAKSLAASGAIGIAQAAELKLHIPTIGSGLVQKAKQSEQ